MNTQEKNILIAKFNGFTKDNDLGWYDNEEFLSKYVFDTIGGNSFDVDELAFDRSWDWLIPAYSKIVKTIPSSPRDCQKCDLQAAFEKACYKNDISMAFEAVFKFINEYKIK